MAQSIIIVGPQGCGKTINAPGLCRAFKVSKWIDEADVHHLHAGNMPKEDHLIFATEWPRNTHSLQCVNFEFAISKVAKPHPMTPKRLVFAGTTGHADFLNNDSGNRRFWPVSGI